MNASTPPVGSSAVKPSARQQSSFFGQWLILFFSLLLLGTQMTFDQIDARRRIEAEAKGRLANHTRVLTGELERRINSINTALLDLRQTAPGLLHQKGGAAHLAHQLTLLTQTLEGVRTIAVFDAAGTVVAASRPDLLRSNYGYRDYFKTLHEQPRPDRLHVSPPFTTAMGVFTLVLARPVYGPRNEFAGIVTATLDMDELHNLLASLHASADTRLSVMHGGGTLLQLFPERPGAQGTGVDQPGFFFRRHRLSDETESLMTGISGTTGTESFISMRTLQPAALQLDTPLIVAAARDESNILAPWLMQVNQRITLFLLAVVLTALALLIYQKRQRSFERQLQKVREERQRSNTVLQRFIDHLPGTAYVKDADSRTLMANRGFATLLGMDPTLMIGKTSRELFPGEFGEKITADDQKVLTDGTTITIEESFNGRDYESTKFIIDAGNGQRQLGGMTLDITPRKEAERALAQQLSHQRELNRKLEAAQSQLLQSEKMASIGQLAAGVAHEINNPIGFINSNLGTLKGYLDDIFAVADAYEEASRTAGPNCPSLDAIRAIKVSKDFDFLRQDIVQLLAESTDGLQRVKKIVQDLKDFSRPGEANWQMADLQAGLESTLNIVWNELKYKCTLRKDYGDLPLVYCLPSQLNQVFMNLLVNASQAIETKGEITLTTRRLDEDSVQINIADTGHGIAPEHLPRLFEPFFTTKPVGKGTGLGLSIVWSIITKHRGKIEVTSQVGQGSCFTITLPVRPLESDITLAAESASAVPPAPTF